MKRRDGFTLRDTNIVKCAAVVLLLTHHLYSGVLPAPIPAGSDPRRVAATLAKVCVALFVLLSGYGLSASYKKRGERDTFKFTVDHVLGLMWPYWLVYMIFTLGGVFLALPEHAPQAVYGTGIRGAVNALTEFFALRPLFGTPTINQTWWYMETALVLYLAFPAVYLAVKKAPAAALPVTFIPLALNYFVGSNAWDTCREIYWFFPFALGIFMEQRGLLEKFAALLCGPRRAAVTLFSLAAAVLCGFIRSLTGIVFDGFFAVSILLLVRATLCLVPYLGGVCEYIGRRSGDIFLIHSFIYYYFITARVFAKLLTGPSRIMSDLALPLLLALSIICAEAMALLRRFVTIKRPEYTPKGPHMITQR